MSFRPWYCIMSKRKEYSADEVDRLVALFIAEDTSQRKFAEEHGIPELSFRRILEWATTVSTVVWF